MGTAITGIIVYYILFSVFISRKHSEIAFICSYILLQVWPAEDTGFPDYLKNSTIDWWVSELQLLHDKLPYSGLWIVSTGNTHLYIK